VLVCAACAPLVSVTPLALIAGVRRSFVFMWVRLVVSDWPLIEVGTPCC
jgi:hypothetical protein